MSTERKTYSQIAQDLYVVKWFKMDQKPRSGYFVDVGAFDGLYLSNTALLEFKYGWKGICIEPLPRAFEQLQKNRKAICVPEAVFSTGGEEVQFSQHHVLSGITSTLDKYQSQVANSPQITVRTRTLTQILDACQAPPVIDYLSIDTEGSDFEVLKGIDLSRYSFRLIHIEHNYVQPRRNQIREFLTSRGYRYVQENQWDDVYALIE